MLLGLPPPVLWPPLLLRLLRPLRANRTLRVDRVEEVLSTLVDMLPTSTRTVLLYVLPSPLPLFIRTIADPPTPSLPTKQGNCGQVSQDSDYVVALPTNTYAGGSHCDQKVSITRVSTGKTITATVKDSCPTCVNDSCLDLSEGAFLAIATASEGMVSCCSLLLSCSVGRLRRALTLPCSTRAGRHHLVFRLSDSIPPSSHFLLDSTPLQKTLQQNLPLRFRIRYPSFRPWRYKLFPHFIPHF